MKILKGAVFFFLFQVFAVYGNAQQLKEDEIVVIKGEKFVIHQVRTGETLYSISKNFMVDSVLLVKFNPTIAEGLKIGDILQIPHRENARGNALPVYKKGDPTGFDYHTITSRKETPYFIAKKYGITVEELYAYNPDRNSFSKDAKIRIPRWEAKVVEKQQEQPVPEIEAEETNRGKGFLVHTVGQGETVFSIAQKYGVSDSEILFYNPNAKNLQAGAQIYLPADNINQAVDNVSEEKKGVANYFEHIVESGETLWGVSRRYGISEEELKTLNPVLATSFPAGTVIKIPVKESEMQAVPVNEEAFAKHTVKKGETLYGIAARYNLTIPEIKEYNPALATRNLIEGETILVPGDIRPQAIQQPKDTTSEPVRPAGDYYKVELPTIIPETCKPLNSEWLSNETFTVALFLPLFTEINDTINKQPVMPAPADSVVVELPESDTALTVPAQTEDLFKGFYGNSENFLQFYEGVLIAIDSLKNAGMNIRLNVFDTEDNPQAIRKFLNDENFLQTDLIIGPISQKTQKEVAPVASKNRIPVVSPLLSQPGDLNSNPYFYQVNPDKNYIAQQTAEMVAEEYFNSNFIVVRTGNYEGTSEGRLVNLIREKLTNSGLLNRPQGGRFVIYDFKTERATGLTRVLSKDKENVLLIPSSVEGELSVAISNLNNLADEYPMTLIAPSRYQQQYKSIEIDKFHNLKLQYISPFWTDYDNPVTIRIIDKFKENYFTEPNSFGMQGYDVAFYFLSALKNYGRGFENCLPYLDVHLLQGDYYFDKVSAMGGYMNKGVSVISYERDYDVVRKRVMGQPGVAR